MIILLFIMPLLITKYLFVDYREFLKLAWFRGK